MSFKELPSDIKEPYDRMMGRLRASAASRRAGSSDAMETFLTVYGGRTTADEMTAYLIMATMTDLLAAVSETQELDVLNQVDRLFLEQHGVPGSST